MPLLHYKVWICRGASVFKFKGGSKCVLNQPGCKVLAPNQDVGLSSVYLSLDAVPTQYQRQIGLLVGALRPLSLTEAQVLIQAQKAPNPELAPLQSQQFEQFQPAHQSFQRQPRMAPARMSQAQLDELTSLKDMVPAHSYQAKTSDVAETVVPIEKMKYTPQVINLERYLHQPPIVEAKIAAISPADTDQDQSLSTLDSLEQKLPEQTQQQEISAVETFAPQSAQPHKPVPSQPYGTGPLSAEQETTGPLASVQQMQQDLENLSELCEPSAETESGPEVERKRKKKAPPEPPYEAKAFNYKVEDWWNNTICIENVTYTNVEFFELLAKKALHTIKDNKQQVQEKIVRQQRVNDQLRETLHSLEYEQAQASVAAQAPSPLAEPAVERSSVPQMAPHQQEQEAFQSISAEDALRNKPLRDKDYDLYIDKSASSKLSYFSSFRDFLKKQQLTIGDFDNSVSYKNDDIVLLTSGSPFTYSMYTFIMSENKQELWDFLRAALRAKGKKL